MPGVTKPYHLTVRQFSDGQYDEGGRSGYIDHLSYSSNPTNYIRAFELIQKDLQTLFEYIDPSWRNLNTFSFRTFELLLRVCTEVEANLKSIFRANQYTRYSKGSRLNLRDYSKINKSHFLSDYEVKMPHWHGRSGSVRRPFESWAKGSSLGWYTAYNLAKHDRAENLKEASFTNLIDAVCGLAVIIASQFHTNDFSTLELFAARTSHNGYETGVGGYFLIKFPEFLPAKERYDFNWQNLQKDKEPFQKFDYDKV